MNKNLVTIIIALIVGAASFYGGMTFQKSRTGQRTFQRGDGAMTRGGNNMPAGQGQQRRQAGPNGSGGDFTAGEISAKDDKSITIKMPDGSSKIIYFSNTTSIGKTAEGSSSDLSVGQQVVINGKSGSDGSISAQNIQIRPAGNQ